MKNKSNHGRLFGASRHSTCPRNRVFLTLVVFGLLTGATLMADPSRRASGQAATPSWRYTGNLNTARSNHTATLLQNGKVLVAGGFDGNHSLNSAELYDPASGTWTSTGNLNTARGNHTATLLPNGRVLVAGGADTICIFCTSFDSTEVYDPVSGTWTSTGNLNTARTAHTATLLSNGKVLAAGGFDGRSFLNSTELYDPATGTWSYSGNLNRNRLQHTSTLLQNGKVLAAGGITFVDVGFGDPDHPTNSAELYDPTTGTWTNTGNLNTARYNHTATLLGNGMVLVASFLDLYQEGIVKRAELYDPATGIWSNAANVIEGRTGQTATLLPNGKVLVAAGFDSDLDLKSAELYDPATGTWSYTANLNRAREGHTATLLPDGRVLVAGGSGNTAELYDPGPISPNLVDDVQFFVRQHYFDFLNREPDTNGFAFWTNEINLCGGDVQCVEVKRINVSASFFLSIEFQESGYLVYRFYKASYGNLTGAPVPIARSEFLPDTQQISQGVIVNQAGWEQVLEKNKQTFASQFVQRARFTSAYPASLSPAQFVDALFANAVLVPSTSERDATINEFGLAITTDDVPARARALRRVAENPTLTQQEFNRAFVLMQYFGYLRRNPNDAPEATLDFQGYNFWLNKLNSFNGNYIEAEMIKAFLSSSEYRQRFAL